MEEFDYKAFQAQVLEQLKSGKPLLGKGNGNYFRGTHLRGTFGFVAKQKRGGLFLKILTKLIYN